MKERFLPRRMKTFGGPVSPAIISDKFVFISGQISTNPETGDIIKGSIEVETTTALNNLKIIVEDLGCTLNDVIKCDVFLSDMKHFDEMNVVYKSFFGVENPPARTCVSVEIWGGMLIEVSAIVRRDL
jgi:2-iminobutanoate/2-iminopropanoate deaminase